jgi:glycosyltransferase involved in cell wall biosynthesis
VRRLLLVGDYPPPYGGLSIQIAALRRRLLALGDDVHVLDIGVHRRERRPECLPVRGPVALARAALGHAGRGATIHVHTNGHNPKSWMVASVCALAGLRAGRRSVVSLGSGLMPAFVRSAHAPLRALVRITLAASGAVIVRNETARATLAALTATPAAVRILAGFYGVAPDDVGRVPGDTARFARDHRPLIGMVSSPGPEYGLALMVDAAARLRARHPALGLILTGADQLDEGQPGWIHATGELPHASVLAVMSVLDVFVRPTYFDGDASTVREALALGVRAVASDTHFRPAGTRVFPQGDADALAATIEDALADPPVHADSSALPDLLEIYDALPLRGRARCQEGAVDGAGLGARVA